MNLQQLTRLVRKGDIDTVLVGFPDPFGRLVGKRFRADFFLESVVGQGTHACSYLLTVNLDMDPLDGFKVANWEAGFGDFALRPDPATLRRLPWQPGAALALCEFIHHDGSPVAEAPRAVLRRQLDRLARLGFAAAAATELEFYLFNQTYPEAFAAGYRHLQPASDYRIDYHLLQPARDEPLFRAIRNQLTAAGIPIESSKGEWSRGQHEVNFTYSDPLEMADRHVVFKQAVKDLAAQHGKAVSFMAKFAPSEAGNSCHIHFSLWRDGRNAFAAPAASARNRKSAHLAEPGSPLFRRFLGGLLKYAPELCLFQAPTINSYKRYQPGSWAPTRMAWATDNRTVGFRVVGQGPAFRVENRMPGADANPYLALAALIAAGLAGVEENLDCGAEYRGNAYVDPALPRLPSSLVEAADRFAASRIARAAFGDAVVEFYTHHARIEHQAFSNAVTDWERVRYFEQI
jgi:glutamine synthetase